MRTVILLSSIPALVWGLSYIYLALYYKKWNLLHTKIHESGQYTFLGTLFYFNHFLRELPIDTFFVVCIYLTYKALALPKLTAVTWLLALILFLIIVVTGSIKQVGLKNTLLDLFQYRELDTVVESGSHWNMHFLSTIVIILMLIWPLTFLLTFNSLPVLVMVIAFLLLCVLFGTNLKAITDPRWLMHGGREIVTFFILGFLPFYLPWIAKFSQEMVISYWTSYTSLALVVLCGYIGYKFLTTNVRGLAQGGYGLPYLLASHFFEHFLDVLYMGLLLAVLYR